MSKVYIMLLAGVMLVAGFFRLYRLAELPPGLYPDVAVNGMNALQTLRSGDYKLFYQDNNGREGLIMWLDAASIRLFGVSGTALKIPAAAAGILTVLGIYLLVQELFLKRAKAIGLLAAFFCASSFWHVNFSRLGFRAILVPLFLVFGFYFLRRAIRTQCPPAARPLGIPSGLAAGGFAYLLAGLGGAAFGLGFYTYASFRLAVPLLACALVLWAIPYFKQKQGGEFLKISLAFLVATFLTALPIGIYFLFNLGDFFGRAGQTSVLAAANPIMELGKSLVLHLGMFNFYGDGNWRHNVPGAPELFLPVGGLFLIAIFIAITKIFNFKFLIFKKNPNNDQAERDKNAYIFLILWLWFLLLPGVLTSEGIPHSLRTIGVIPAVMILAAAGGAAVYGWLQARIGKKILVALTGVFLAAVLAQGYWQYFVVWAKNPEVQGAFTTRFAKVGQLTSKLYNEGCATAVVVNEDGVAVPYPDGMPMPAQTVMYIESANCYQNEGAASERYCTEFSRFLKPEQIEQLQINQKTTIVPMKDEEKIFDRLKEKFINGRTNEKDGVRYFEVW